MSITDLSYTPRSVASRPRDKRLGLKPQSSVAAARDRATQGTPILKADNRALSSPVWKRVTDAPLVRLEDLTERSCRWPIGDPHNADFGFCGEGVAVRKDRRGNPVGHHRYCEHHQSRAVAPKETK